VASEEAPPRPSKAALSDVEEEHDVGEESRIAPSPLLWSHGAVRGIPPERVDVVAEEEEVVEDAVARRRETDRLDAPKNDRHCSNSSQKAQPREHDIIMTAG